MNRIRHERKNKLSSKYHQLVEQRNSQHVLFSCAMQLIDFN